MDWGTPALPLWRFWLGICMCSGGYAAVVAVLISVYSKVLEGLDQVKKSQNKKKSQKSQKKKENFNFLF